LIGWGALATSLPGAKIPTARNNRGVCNPSEDFYLTHFKRDLSQHYRKPSSILFIFHVQQVLLKKFVSNLQK